MMKRNRKVIIIIILILVGLIGFIRLAMMLSPGSYAYAEIYELNYSETQVIEAVSKFKIQHPEMIVPRVTFGNQDSIDLSESEGRKDNSHWYFIYFYFPQANQVVLTWTRQSEPGKTSFAFVSLNNGLEIGHWKDINHDFHSTENKQYKKEFEERILVPIKKILISEK